MRAIKLKLDLFEDAAEAVRGLDLHTVHSKLGPAEKAVADREQDLAQRRAELAALERRLEQLPSAVAAGRVPASELGELIRTRDSVALLIAPAEAAVVAAKDKLAAERLVAKGLLDAEFDRRVDVLAAAAALIAPLLDAINEQAVALSRTRGDGGLLRIGWPAPLVDQLQQRQQLYRGETTWGANPAYPLATEPKP